jgi:flagellar basal body rod protein FlgG
MSASGAHAQSHRMKVLSNNLANVETPGFKPQQSVLQARFAEMIEQGDVVPGMGGADDIGGGVTIRPSETQYAQGPMKATGRETDFAINDEESFFVVSRGDEQRLTRAGNFLFDSQGRMINENGDKVLATNGQPIEIEPGIPINVGPDGRILGDSQFKALAEFDVVQPGARKVVSGMLEQSAVSPTGAMMELIETSRVYEANVRMIQNQDSVMGTLISRVLQS